MGFSQQNTVSFLLVNFGNAWQKHAADCCILEYIFAKSKDFSLFSGFSLRHCKPETWAMHFQNVKPRFKCLRLEIYWLIVCDLDSGDRRWSTVPAQGTEDGLVSYMQGWPLDNKMSIQRFVSSVARVARCRQKERWTSINCCTAGACRRSTAWKVRSTKPSWRWKSQGRINVVEEQRLVVCFCHISLIDIAVVDVTEKAWSCNPLTLQGGQA